MHAQGLEPMKEDKWASRFRPHNFGKGRDGRPLKRRELQEWHSTIQALCDGVAQKKVSLPIPEKRVLIETQVITVTEDGLLFGSPSDSRSGRW